MPLVFTANLIISFMEGVKRCIVLFLLDRTCEHEQARRARFLNGKRIFSGKKRLPKLCAKRFHRCFAGIFTSAGSLPVYEARNHFDEGSK